MADNDRIDLSMFLDDYLNDCREGFQQINSGFALSCPASSAVEFDEARMPWRRRSRENSRNNASNPA